MIALRKRYPLAISRGVSTGSNNLFVFVSDGIHEGVGEGAPGVAFDDETLTDSIPPLEELVRDLDRLLEPDGVSIAALCIQARERQIVAPSRTALECALWDLLAKRAGMPLFQLFGLSRNQVATSLTIGLNPSEVIRERVPEILRRTGAKALKIKLGSPEGRERDREQFAVAAEAAAPFHVKLRVDANGGWTVPEALEMISWLAARGCDYLEQPLPQGSEGDLALIFPGRAMPIFVDESIHTSQDVVKVAANVDGVNLKLMKTGGLIEARAVVATARAFGLKTMIGCMGESSVAISCGASIGSLFDHIDLDSHLNLMLDPAEGAPLIDGVLVPPLTPGHGAKVIHHA